jgi:uncharacterized protein (DUF1330 family)
MSAYLIVHATVKDADKLQKYAAGAGPTLDAHGGEFVIRGGVFEVFTGSHDHQMSVIIKFPDGDSLRAWYASDAYQAMIPTRSQAMDATFIGIEEPPQ